MSMRKAIPIQIQKESLPSTDYISGQENKGHSAEAGHVVLFHMTKRKAKDRKQHSLGFKGKIRVNQPAFIIEGNRT